MSSSTTAINLAELPPPDVVRQVSYDDELARLKVRFLELYPLFSANVESDPVTKMLELMAHELVRYRQQKNEDLKATMLAFAKKNDLEHKGAGLNVKRLTIQEGDPDASPPVEAIKEDDEDYRARIQLAPEDFTNAGTWARYRAVALAAHGDVKDANPYSPVAGYVTIPVLSRQGDGTPTEELLNAVRAAVNAPDVYQLTDNVTVTSASVIRYRVEAELVIQSGPDASLVLAAAQAKLQTYVDGRHAMGRPVSLDGILAALHVPGVERVNLISPTAHIEPGDSGAAYCEQITIREAS